MSAEAEHALQFLCSMPIGHTTLRTKDYRDLMLNTDGSVMARGSLYNIRGKSLGAGVYEVRLVRSNP